MRARSFTLLGIAARGLVTTTGPVFKTRRPYRECAVVGHRASGSWAVAWALLSLLLVAAPARAETPLPLSACSARYAAALSGGASRPSWPEFSRTVCGVSGWQRPDRAADAAPARWSLRPRLAARRAVADPCLVRTQFQTAPTRATRTTVRRAWLRPRHGAFARHPVGRHHRLLHGGRPLRRVHAVGHRVQPRC